MSRRKRKNKNVVDGILALIVIGIVALSLLFFVIISLYLNSGMIGRIFLIVVAILLLFGVPAAFIFFHLRRRRKQLEQLRSLNLESIDTMPGHAFEHYIAQLLEYQGYKATVTKGSGDLGIDIIAEKDGARYAVQCKRYSNNISRTAVSDAVAGKQHYKCTHAMVVTNQHFTAGAIELAKSTQCLLIDRTTLTAWLLSFQQQNNTLVY